MLHDMNDTVFMNDERWRFDELPSHLFSVRPARNSERFLALIFRAFILDRRFKINRTTLFCSI